MTSTDTLHSSNIVQTLDKKPGSRRVSGSSSSSSSSEVNGSSKISSLGINGNIQSGFVLDVNGQTVFRSSTYIFGGQLFINTSGTSIILTTPVSTGVHTTSGNHLPISINGTTYWIALLNPPVIP
jgi:hypothetical protein